MLETRAIVIRLDGVDAIVESRPEGGCGHCDSRKSCGTGKLSQLFLTAPRRFRVRNGIEARIGEEVQVSVADGVLLRSALVMYFLPLLLLFAGGMLGGQWAPDAASSDAWSAMGAALGLAAGFLLIKRTALRHTSAGHPPVISRRGW